MTDDTKPSPPGGWAPLLPDDDALAALESAAGRVQAAVEFAKQIAQGSLSADQVWPIAERILDGAEDELEAATVEDQIDRYSKAIADPVLEAFNGGAQ